jgi:hypothetical protein
MTKPDFVDCVFLLADKQMEYTFKGFLERDNYHQRLGIRPFTRDIKVDYAGNDPGVYTRSHEILRSYCHTHRHAVVALDCDWRGAPAASQIQARIKQNLMQNGWREMDVEVIVIEPELEMWLWQDTPYIASAFNGFNHQPFPSLRKWLENQNLWLSTDLKPARPKEVFELVARRAKLPLSSAIYQKIAQQVSVHRCADPAFCQLRETLQRWFPVDGDE